MSVITVSSSDKDIELTSLEAHVRLEAQRFKALEERISRIEKKVDEIIEQAKASKRIIIGAVVTIITSTVTSAITILIKFH